jgi:SpoVK/Ycf46/Vps4 family AAA+-type ATPase
MASSPESDFQRRLKAVGSAFRVSGIPTDAEPRASALLRSRLLSAADSFCAGHEQWGDVPLSFTVWNGSSCPSGRPGRSSAADPEVTSIEDRASYFVPADPRYSFEFLVLPRKTMDELLLAVDMLEVRDLVFGRWNLRRIEPRPGSAINLHGSPGTGKTLAAHAIAARLKRKIIQAKYSQLESKYHGEGPKNLDALFYAAKTHDAVLFLDEADALMSQRFETTSQGSEHAVNAMRSELVMSLDQYDGLVIFATNFVRSYDTAFDSRVRHIEFPKPDAGARAAIWTNHFPRELPLAADVSVSELAAIDDVTGRDIRRAVIDAATAVALAGAGQISQADLKSAVERIKERRISRAKPIGVEPGSSLEHDITKEADRTLPAGTGRPT